MEAAVGTAAEGTNDWVDNQLLAAVAGNASELEEKKNEPE
jgi:hypothetical protein